MSSLETVGGGTNEATIYLEGDTAVVTNGLTIETNATLAGSITLDGSVTNSGTISPGASPGRFNITDQLVLNTPSRLRLEIGGFDAAKFDSIGVAGGVTLGGTLSVSLLPSFPAVMTNGASFTLLTAGAPFTGSFANVASGGTLTTSEGYARFTVLYAGDNALRLANLVIVDTDSDGLPDWWEDQFGLSKTNAADVALDADGDGASNGHEFQAGTNPTNAASVFRIVGLASEEGGVTVTWNTAGGRNYVVQTNAFGSGNGLGASFGDYGGLIAAPGPGDATTNVFLPYGPAAADYLRIRLGP